MTGRQETPTLEKRSVSQGVPGRRSRPGSGGATPRRRTSFILQLLGAVLVLSSVIVGLSASHAGAATLSNGTVAIRTVPSGSLATNPLHDQDTVELVVAPNSTLSRSSLETAGFPSGAAVIKVLECADLDGSAANLPKKSTDCDPTTTFPTANLQENGSVFVSKYKVYALPDESVLGPSNGTVCDDAEHQCVLGFFSNQNDFTKPYLFSAPFQVAPATASGTASAGTALSPSSSSSSAGTGTSASAGASAAGLRVFSHAGEHRWIRLVAVAVRRGSLSHRLRNRVALHPSARASGWNLTGAHGNARHARRTVPKSVTRRRRVVIFWLAAALAAAIVGSRCSAE